MLILSRRPEEKIHIGNNITITVVEVRGNKVRIGLEAPVNVPILRGELIQNSAPIETKTSIQANQETS